MANNSQAKFLQGFSDRVLQLQLKHLRPSTRRYLSRHLDPLNNVGVARCGVTQDWKGLAELINMDNATISQIEHQRHDSPTDMVLKLWESKYKATIQQLLEKIHILERFDMLQDLLLKELLKNDFHAFQKAEEDRVEREAKLACMSKAELFLHRGEELTVDGDVFYDAFVVFHEDDMDFVEQVIEQLEEKENFRLCFNIRNMMPGGAKEHNTARVIAERCRKVMLILSPSFLNCEECLFVQRFAHSMSPAARKQILLPLKPKPCAMPIELNFIACVDFFNPRTKQFGWKRVTGALRLNRERGVMLSDEQIGSIQEPVPDSMFQQTPKSIQLHADVSKSVTRCAEGRLSNSPHTPSVKAGNNQGFHYLSSDEEVDQNYSSGDTRPKQSATPNTDLSGTKPVQNQHPSREAEEHSTSGEHREPGFVSNDSANGSTVEMPIISDTEQVWEERRLMPSQDEKRGDDLLVHPSFSGDFSPQSSASGQNSMKTESTSGSHQGCTSSSSACEHSCSDMSQSNMSNELGNLNLRESSENFVIRTPPHPSSNSLSGPHSITSSDGRSMYSADFNINVSATTETTDSSSLGRDDYHFAT